MVGAESRPGHTDDDQDDEDHPCPGGDLPGASHQSWPPALAKKLMSTMAPPVKAAAAKATSTPVFPRPASTGFELWDPSAHTMAAMTSPATEATSPIVSIGGRHVASGRQTGLSDEQ